METHHIRRTTFDHLSYEELVRDAGQFEVLPKNALYRLADELVNAGHVSAQDYRVLKEIIGTSGDDYLCSCSNRTLALRLGFAHVSQVSRAIRRLRDAGLLTAKDSGNCKREGGFGISIAILHVRYDELSSEVKWRREEEKQRTRQQRLYETAKRRIVTILKYNDVAEELAHVLYEAKEMAKAVINDARERTSAVFAQAAMLIQKSISKVLSLLGDAETLSNLDTNLTYGHDNFAIHIPITTLNPTRISNDKMQSANADQLFPSAASRGEKTLKKEYGGLDETIKRNVGRESTNKRADLSLEMVMAACPSIKPYLQRPVSGWPDLIDQCDAMARMCGVNVSAVQEGLHILGKQQFAVAMAIVLHKSLAEDETKRVKKPGGYVRGMIAKAVSGELHLDRTIFGLLSEQAA